MTLWKNLSFIHWREDMVMSHIFWRFLVSSWYKTEETVGIVAVGQQIARLIDDREVELRELLNSLLVLFTHPVRCHQPLDQNRPGTLISLPHDQGWEQDGSYQILAVRDTSRSRCDIWTILRRELRSLPGQVMAGNSYLNYPASSPLKKRSVSSRTQGHVPLYSSSPEPRESRSSLIDHSSFAAISR